MFIMYPTSFFEIWINRSHSVIPASQSISDKILIEATDRLASPLCCLVEFHAGAGFQVWEGINHSKPAFACAKRWGIFG